MNNIKEKIEKEERRNGFNPENSLVDNTNILENNITPVNIDRTVKVSDLKKKILALESSIKKPYELSLRKSRSSRSSKFNRASYSILSQKGKTNDLQNPLVKIKTKRSKAMFDLNDTKEVSPKQQYNSDAIAKTQEVYPDPNTYISGHNAFSSTSQKRLPTVAFRKESEIRDPTLRNEVLPKLKPFNDLYYDIEKLCKKDITVDTSTNQNYNKVPPLDVFVPPDLGFRSEIRPKLGSILADNSEVDSLATRGKPPHIPHLLPKTSVGLIRNIKKAQLSQPKKDVFCKFINPVPQIENEISALKPEKLKINSQVQKRPISSRISKRPYAYVNPWSRKRFSSQSCEVVNTYKNLQHFNLINKEIANNIIISVEPTVEVVKKSTIEKFYPSEKEVKKSSRCTLKKVRRKPSVKVGHKFTSTVPLKTALSILMKHSMFKNIKFSDILKNKSYNVSSALNAISVKNFVSKKIKKSESKYNPSKISVHKSKHHEMLTAKAMHDSKSQILPLQSTQQIFKEILSQKPNTASLSTGSKMSTPSNSYMMYMYEKKPEHLNRGLTKLLHRNYRTNEDSFPPQPKIRCSLRKDESKFGVRKYSTILSIGDCCLSIPDIEPNEKEIKRYCNLLNQYSKTYIKSTPKNTQTEQHHSEINVSKIVAPFPAFSEVVKRDSWLHKMKKNISGRHFRRLYNTYSYRPGYLTKFSSSKYSTLFNFGGPKKKPNKEKKSSEEQRCEISSLDETRKNSFVMKNFIGNNKNIFLRRILDKPSTLATNSIIQNSSQDCSCGNKKQCNLKQKIKKKFKKVKKVPCCLPKESKKCKACKTTKVCNPKKKVYRCDCKLKGKPQKYKKKQKKQKKQLKCDCKGFEICPTECAKKSKKRNIMEDIINYFKARPGCPTPEEIRQQKLRQKAYEAARAAGLEICEKQPECGRVQKPKVKQQQLTKTPFWKRKYSTLAPKQPSQSSIKNSFSSTNYSTTTAPNKKLLRDLLYNAAMRKDKLPNNHVGRMYQVKLSKIGIRNRLINQKQEEDPYTYCHICKFVPIKPSIRITAKYTSRRQPRRKTRRYKLH